MIIPPIGGLAGELSLAHSSALTGAGSPLNTQRWPVSGTVTRTNGRPTAQWSRLEAGRSDDLAAP